MPPHDTSAELAEAASLAATLTAKHPAANVRKMVYLGCYSWRETRLAAVERSLNAVGLPDRAFQRFATAAARPWLARSDSPSPPEPPARSCYFYRSPGFISRAKGGPLPADTRRFYLALRASDAQWFLSAAAAALDEALPTFAMKCLASPASYRRADAGVIYVPKADAATALDALQGAIGAVGLRLRPTAPLGTCPVTSGLAWADSLLDEAARDMSFGLWLTDLILDASTSLGGRTDKAALADLVQERGRSLDSVYRSGTR